MTFYTLNYIQNNQNTNKNILYILIIITLVALIVFTFLHLKERFTTRYRDLGIIALLLLCIFAGKQFEDLTNVNQQNSEVSQIIPFIKSVAQDKGVKNSDVVVNATNLTNGLIVRINSKNEDYQLNLNDDKNSYTLTRAHVINHTVKVVN